MPSFSESLRDFFLIALPFLGKTSDGVPPFSPISRYYPGVVSYTFTVRPEGGYPPLLKRFTFDFGHTCRSRTTLSPPDLGETREVTK